jgi:hypothetical protein
MKIISSILSTNNHSKPWVDLSVVQLKALHTRYIYPAAKAANAHPGEDHQKNQPTHAHKMANQQQKQVVLAMGRSLGCWLLVYVALAHVLVVWKWQTPPSSSSSSSLMPLQEEAVFIDETTATSADVTTDTDPQRLLVDQVKLLEATAVQLENAVKDAVAHNGQLEQAVLLEQAALAAATQPHTVSVTVQETKSLPKVASVEHLRTVLQRSNLVLDQDVMPNETLAETLDLALSELRQIIALRDWPSAARVLPIGRSTLPRDPIPSAKASSLTLCHKQPSSSTRLNQTLVEQAKANMSQTFASQANVAPFLPLSLADSVAHVQDALQMALTNATIRVAARLDQARRQAVAAAHGGGGGSNVAEMDSATATATTTDCGWTAEQDAQVLAWLDAGLEAMHNSAAQTDVRTALRQALQAYDIDTSTLILDADLTASSSSSSQQPSQTGRPRRPNNVLPSTINLGQLLDTPTLHESAVLMDYVLQWIHSLHYDVVDDLLDAHVYSKVPDDVPTIGPVAVDYVLQRAGQVDISVPPWLWKGRAALWR